MKPQSYIIVSFPENFSKGETCIFKEEVEIFVSVDAHVSNQFFFPWNVP